MPGRYIITSRKGVITSIEVYSYTFTSELLNQFDKKNKLCSWLSNNSELVINEINESGFTTLTPLVKENTWQYSFNGITLIHAPFNNTAHISELLSRLIKSSYKINYKQFLNRNIFIIDEVELHPFKLLKCFQFNIEIFADGLFYIHFLPLSKVVNCSLLDESYIYELNNRFTNSTVSDMQFSLVGLKNFRRNKLLLKESKLEEKVKTFLETQGTAIATFDYHFLASYDPSIFGKITDLTVNVLNEAIAFLLPISDGLKLPDFAFLNKKPFSEIQIVPLLNPKNLLVGNNTKVNLQSAAYHNGMFKQVDDKIIQPIAVDGYETNEFKNLINNHFNKNGTAEVFDAIHISTKEDIHLSEIIELKERFGSDILFPIFTKYKLANDFLRPLLNLRIRYQLISGSPNSSQLSNFAVKCLEKSGGLLSAINNLYEPETTYFIGIDMGHTTHNEEDYSNLCMVIFDNKGCFLSYKVIEKIAKNEALNEVAIDHCLYAIKKSLKKIKLLMPKKIIIHRDGKVHNNDISILITQVSKQFGSIELDVLEVIKSGYPVIANFINNEYHNLKSGDYWILQEKKYAILITNVQADQKGFILNPIIVKQKHGTTDFGNLVEQLYWFTKIYTNNLFNSTRLPATTERANNFVSTSNKEHRSTYLA